MPEATYRQWLEANITYCRRKRAEAQGQATYEYYRTQLDVFQDALVQFNKVFGEPK